MGVVAPAYFIPAANDPYLHALSRFVIARALADSRQFANANHARIYPPAAACARGHAVH
jgi:predicted signal transduction protein with EAL and GGDEF domain